MKRRILLLVLFLTGALVVYKLVNKVNINFRHEVGDAIDSLNHVLVYYNGGVDHSAGRNLAPDNYNIGIRYQCVEFVKRYYYQHLHHKMPDAFGHAKDFFDKNLPDGMINTKRNLVQFKNRGCSKPLEDDLIVFGATFFNPYGHVAIVSAVYEDEIEIIQQNPGPFGKSREILPLTKLDSVWEIKNTNVLGWLRK